MPKSHFSIEDATSLSEIAPKSKIHVSGVCGVAMAQLAIELSKQGFQVSGSDKEFYEPMGSLLRGSPVVLCQGYKAAHIPADVALVVIGNALPYENPEIQEVESRQLPYSLFPKIIFDLLIKGRNSIVVSGTHGKSTTSGMLAFLLTQLNLDPSYFIGAVVPDLRSSLVIGAKNFSVVEGDEYDSAFFAKAPKFNFYKPNTLIISAIEYDHADIYPSLKAIEDVFTKLVLSLPEDATVICCTDCQNIRRLLPEWQAVAGCQFVTYGQGQDADLKLIDCKQAGLIQHLTVEMEDGVEFSYSLAIPGKHNALNSVAALGACLYNDLDLERVGRLISSYRGARRRQEVRCEANGITLIDDFAHHPTAVHATLLAVSAAYPGRRLWAIFEPRSNTSRRSVFRQSYVKAFSIADQVVLCEVTARTIDSVKDLIDVTKLAEEIGLAGTPSIACNGPDEIFNYVSKHLERGDVVLVMSNGSFGGLVDRLVSLLRT